MSVPPVFSRKVPARSVLSREALVGLSADLFEVDDFGSGRTVAVLFQAGGVRDPEVFTIDEPPLSERDSEPDLKRIEYEPFVSQPDSETERGEEFVLEDVG